MSRENNIKTICVHFLVRCAFIRMFTFCLDKRKNVAFKTLCVCVFLDLFRQKYSSNFLSDKHFVTLTLVLVHFKNGFKQSKLIKKANLIIKKNLL